jgi:hypothetical protein
MITIKTVLLLILAGYFHIIRDRIETQYSTTIFARLPEWLQKWFNPVISWENKKSDVAIWQIIKSVILVDFTDFKHFLKMLEINTFIWLIHTVYPYFGLHEWIAAYIIRGGGVYIGNMNMFGDLKAQLLPTKKVFSKRIFVVISFVISISYLVFIQIKYGQLFSISASAKYEPNFFFAFIWFLAAFMALIGNSWYVMAGASLLAIIGTATGYNPELTNDNLQDIVHVVCTMSAIGLVMVDVIVKGFKHKKYMLLAVVLVSLFLLFTGYMLAFRIAYRTYWIEVACLGVVYLFYWMYKIE